jgi:hypothetical protein
MHKRLVSGMVIAAGCAGHGAVNVDSSSVPDMSDVGSISIMNRLTSSESSAYAYAEFSRTLESCATVQHINTCDVGLLCTEPPKTYYGAGQVTFTNTAVPLVLNSDMSGYYAPIQMSDLAFAPLDQVSAHTAGSDVHSVDLVTTAPSQVVVTNQPLDFSAVPSTNDLALSWFGSDEGSVQVAFHAGTDETNLFTCVFPAMAGAANIPSAVLSSLTGQSGELDFISFSESSVSSTPWTINFRLGYEDAWSDNTTARTAMLIQ